MLTACLVDLPPAFSSFSFFSCFSYCFSSSFCFCWYIFLKATGQSGRTSVGAPLPATEGVIRTEGDGTDGRPCPDSEAQPLPMVGPLTVIAPVVVEPLGVQVDDVSADIIQEALVMGDDEQRLPPALQVAGF